MFKQFMGGSRLAKLAGITLATGIIAGAFHTTAPVKASDHDDGETRIKARNLNLTDLYVFREDWQTQAQSAVAHAGADTGRMVFIMNTNPRSLPRQQYFFNTNAVYTFWVSRVANRDLTPTAVPDMAFDFNFGAPDTTTGAQSITLNLRRFVNGVQTGTVETLPAGSTVAPPLLSSVLPATQQNGTAVNAAGNNEIRVFAGLREDPFFFDVDAFFRTRGVLGIGPAYAPVPVGNRSGLIGNLGNPVSTTANAIDFAKGYNVNAIVMRVPIALLSDGTNNRVFDVWETISVPESFAALQ